MSGSRGRLSYAQLPAIPAEYRPEIDPRERAVRMVHLGIGAFHRAHQASFTERSGSWATCGVTQRTRDVVEQLAPQDCLYTLLERSGGDASLRVIGAVREVMFAGDDPAAVVRRLADPAVSVVTMTVTEKGYRHDPDTGALRLEDPEVAADLTGRPPRTVVGQLAAAIAARAAVAAGPLTVLSCDNIPGNGALVGGLVRAFLERVNGSGAALGWLDDHAAFPSTMVDRIVPATAPADRELVAGRLGVDDFGTVVTEPFAQWVIENRFAGDRPQWERAGALLVDDVAPYERLKLRTLNGTHSSLAYLGGLAGYRTIASAVAEPVLAGFARALMRHDVVPTLTIPPGVDLARYQESVLERFANPALGHRTAQVAMDGSHKLPQRLLGTVRDRRAAGAEPVRATLGVAAWMRHVATGRADDGSAFEPDDPMVDVLRAVAPAGASAEKTVDGLLGVGSIFGDLADDRWFRDALVRFVDDLDRHGVLAVVAGVS